MQFCGFSFSGVNDLVRLIPFHAAEQCRIADNSGLAAAPWLASSVKPDTKA